MKLFHSLGEHRGSGHSEREEVALAAVIHAGFVTFMAGRAGQVAVMLRVRIHLFRIGGFCLSRDLVIPSVALHAGLMAV